MWLELGMLTTKGNVDVIMEDTKNNPFCPHGPTILFSKKISDTYKKYFACSACRDRKQCNFFLWEYEKLKFKKEFWAAESQKFIKDINHQEMFLNLHKLRNESNISKRIYCSTCNILCTDEETHKNHTTVKSLTDYVLTHPSEILPALNNSKKEAQYHFTKSTIEVMINILDQLKYKNVICLGTPRIHEYIQTNCDHMTSILLDIDKRYHNFFAPSQFCWYNMFNNHFFLQQAEEVFKTYLQSDSGRNMILITDPPFGGRTEILSVTFRAINEKYKVLNNKKADLAIFWIYPYFMEPQILNSFPDLSMLDYKVEYDNHQSFQNSSTKRKQGSPVRIFTNISPSLVKFPSTDYKYCKLCDRWVAKENKHCGLCNACTSKNGDTYVHCDVCNRCVKPTWKHCDKCNRCTQIDHVCKIIDFVKECFNCKELGHKKVDCPSLKVAKGKKRKDMNTSRVKNKMKKK